MPGVPASSRTFLLYFTFLPVYNRLLPARCSYVLVCDSYVTRMYSYVIRMWSYVTRMCPCGVLVTIPFFRAYARK